MNIPLVMNAAPIDSNNNQIKSNETEFISKNSILPNNISNTKKKTNVNTLKNLIQNIHDNDNNEEGDLYNSLSNYESVTQKSSKPKYNIDNDLINSSNTQLAYSKERNNNNTTSNLNIENKEEVLQKLNYIIYTLDKQKDIKSDQKIEELLLYSFLGVFIIYVLDSFTKIGKYKR
tara:strand:- start:43 stop:567 length:525 start_codon:yes stop_codon:yes gene_type:complete